MCFTRKFTAQSEKILKIKNSINIKKMYYSYYHHKFHRPQDNKKNGGKFSNKKPSPASSFAWLLVESRGVVPSPVLRYNGGNGCTCHPCNTLSDARRMPHMDGIGHSNAFRRWSSWRCLGVFGWGFFPKKRKRKRNET